MLCTCVFGFVQFRQHLPCTGYCTILSSFPSRFCYTEGRILPVMALFLIALLCFCENFHFDAWFHLQFSTLRGKMEYLSAWFTSIASCFNYGVLTLFEIDKFQISVGACKLSLWMSACYCCCCCFIYFLQCEICQSLLILWPQRYQVGKFFILFLWAFRSLDLTKFLVY